MFLPSSKRSGAGRRFEVRRLGGGKHARTFQKGKCSKFKRARPPRQSRIEDLVIKSETGPTVRWEGFRLRSKPLCRRQRIGTWCNAPMGGGVGWMVYVPKQFYAWPNPDHAQHLHMRYLIKKSAAVNDVHISHPSHPLPARISWLPDTNKNSLSAQPPHLAYPGKTSPSLSPSTSSSSTKYSIRRLGISFSLPNLLPGGLLSGLRSGTSGREKLSFRSLPLD